MVNTKASPRKRVPASSATKVQKVKADLAAEQAARSSLAAARAQKAKASPVAESPAQASLSARRSSASTVADTCPKSVIYAKRAPPKASMPAGALTPPQTVQASSSSPNFTFGGSGGGGVVDWFAGLGGAGDGGAYQESSSASPQPDANAAAPTQAQKPNLEPPTSESTWGGWFCGATKGLTPASSFRPQSALKPEDEEDEDDQPSFRFGGGGRESEAPALQQRRPRERVLPRSARENSQEPPMEAMRRRFSPDRRPQEQEHHYHGGPSGRFGRVREAITEALSEMLSDAKAWLEWLSRALILALAGTGLAFLFFLALSRRRDSTLPFCDHFAADASDSSGEGGSNITDSNYDNVTSSSPICVPCPAHGECRDEALVSCASGYELVDLRYDQPNESSVSGAAATEAAAGVVVVGTGRCVQTWTSWILAIVSQYPWLLVLLGVVIWIIRQRRREQWCAAAAERWLHTCWALLADNDLPIPVDWLQHKVLLDELRTPARMRSCGASRVWKERVLPVLLADPRLRFAPSQVEGEPKECVRVLSPAALRHAAAPIHRHAKTDANTRHTTKAEESNSNGSNSGLWRSLWNAISPEKAD